VATHARTARSSRAMADDFDLIWDDVCCACRNKNVSIRDERLQVAPCGHKLYVSALTQCVPVDFARPAQLHRRVLAHGRPCRL